MSKSRITQPSQPSSGETSTRFTTPSMPSPAIGAAATSDFFPTTLRLVMRLSRPSRSRVCCDSTRRTRSRYNHARRQARRSVSLRFLWEPEKALAAPNPDDAYAVGVQPVDDAQRRMDDLAKLSEPELRHHPAALRELGEALDLRDDLRSSRSPTSRACCSAYQARIASRSSTAEAAKVTRRLRGTSVQTETLLDLQQIRLAPLLQIHEALDDVAEKRSLLDLGFVLGQRLHDRDATSPAGQKHRSPRLINLMHDPAGVHLQITQRDNVFGKLGRSHGSSAQSPVYDAESSTYLLVLEQVLPIGMGGYF